MFEIETSQGFSTELWVEKYRPKHVKDCILPSRLKTPFLNMVKSGEIQNIHLTGTAGTGKTTIARALCNDVGVEYKIINCSNDSGIDTVRTDIFNYCNTASISNTNKAYKVIILDEFDGFGTNSQKAMRGLIEQFSKNVRFILTSNDSTKVHPALNSRCIEYNFTLSAKEREELIPEVASRIVDIMANENIEFDESQIDSIISVVDKHYPDMRKIVGVFNNHTKSGKLSDFVDIDMTSNVDELVSAIQSKQFKKCLDWIMNHQYDIENIYNLKNGIYNHLKNVMKDKTQIPDLIKILGDGNKNLRNCVDQNMQAAETCVLIFTTIEF